MGDPNAFAYTDGEYPAGPKTPPGPYKFSQDELRVLQECNNESFIKRSVPLGTAFGLTAFFGVQNGMFKANPRFGAFPKVTLAVIVGYFMGKISYQQACAEKLMALPNSYIGQLLREKKEGRAGTTSQRPSPLLGITSEDIYSDAGPGNSLDLDLERPFFGDDSYRPGSDSGSFPVEPSAENTPGKPSLSYEELRRRNRGDYSDSRQDPYKMDQNIPPITRARPSPPQAPSTNKYGDSME